MGSSRPRPGWPPAWRWRTACPSSSPTVAAVHAGWRGTLARIAAAGVQAIAGLAGAPPRRLLAAIGPSIGPCCYQVSPDLAGRFAAELGPVVREAGEGPHLDLWEANRRILLESGLEERCVEVLGRCTSCDTAAFFSHRRDQGRTGRQVAFIAPRVRVRDPPSLTGGVGHLEFPRP
jgi:polyphenol oxidase